jgi:hypothetical protein
MPFDFHNDDHPEGLASARVRMMQPYAGKGRGMQFPMAKGTEVLLTFVDGDPDRPLIAGAINTAAAPGPVSAGNQTESVIQTGANNKIRMEDKAGSERIVFESPASNSWIRVGASNDPPSLNGSSGFFLEKDAIWTDPGATFTTTEGNPPFVLPTYSTIYALPADIKKDNVVTAWDSSQIGAWEFKYKSTNSHGTPEIAMRSFTVFDNANTTTDVAGGDLSADGDGIRINTAGNLWLESQNRYAEFIAGTPPIDGMHRNDDSAATAVSHLGDMRDNFGKGYLPTGMKNYNTKIDQPSFQRDVLASAHVKLSSFDTVTTQEGNIYDFGGYWNYNLGNSYAEDHTNQCAELNAKHSNDLLDLNGPQWTKIVWPVKNKHEFDVAKGAAIGAGVGLASGGLVGAGIGAGVGAGIAALGNLSDSGLTEASTKLEGAHWAGNQDSTTGGKVWVQKKFGNDYEYHEGDSISVKKGDTLDVVHGGDHIEVKYDGKGNVRSWSKGGMSKKWTGAGILVSKSSTTTTNSSVTTDDKKYDCNTGALYNHSSSSGTGMGLAKFHFDYSNTVALAINTGTSLSSETFLGAKISNSNFLGVKVNVDFCAAGIIKVENLKGETNIPGVAIKFGLTNMDSKASDMKAALNEIATITNNVAVGGVALENYGPRLMNALVTLLN